MTADDTPAVPDTEAIREALAWLRDNQTSIDLLSGSTWSNPVMRHAATIVRAALGRDDVGSTPDLLRESLYEQLAAAQHVIWSHWMRYLLGSKTEPVTTEPTGRLIRTADVEHWQRQIATPYAELTEREKASDREQVDRFWPLVSERAGTAHTDAQAKLDRISALHYQADDDPGGPPYCPECNAYDGTGSPCRTRQILDDDWREDWPSHRAGTVPTDEPPAGLPPTLASVDDVRQVCEAAGMKRSPHADDEEWTAEGVKVKVTGDLDGRMATVYMHVLLLGRRPIADLYRGSETPVMWAAIQAARSAS